MPALLLHWFFSMILIGSTSARTASVAYSILISLYAYTVVIMIGFFTASGLLYVRYFSYSGQDWTTTSGFKPWGGPTAAIVYASLCAFLAIAAFVPPKEGSPFLTEVKWYVIPTVSLSLLFLGYVYYLGLAYAIPRFFKKGKQLVADREAIIVRENGEYVQFLEIVETAWEAKGEEKRSGYRYDDEESEEMGFGPATGGTGGGVSGGGGIFANRVSVMSSQ